MPSTYIATSSAAIAFHLPGAPRLILFLSYGGTPDKVKEALRRACSHRRTMVISRTPEYLFNVIGQLHRTLPQDAGALHLLRKTRHIATRHSSSYHYEIGISGKHPIITWGSENSEDLTEPFFRWLGSEWRRPKKVREPRTGKARGGRPSGLRRKHPELFNLGALSLNGKALDLKDTKRKVHVDFTGVESIDRSRGETISLFEDAIIDDELSSDSQQVPGAI